MSLSSKKRKFSPYKPDIEICHPIPYWVSVLPEENKTLWNLWRIHEHKWRKGAEVRPQGRPITNSEALGAWTNPDP